MVFGRSDVKTVPKATGFDSADVLLLELLRPLVANEAAGAIAAKAKVAAIARPKRRARRDPDRPLPVGVAVFGVVVIVYASPMLWRCLGAGWVDVDGDCLSSEGS